MRQRVTAPRFGKAAGQDLVLAVDEDEGRLEPRLGH